MTNSRPAIGVSFRSPWRAAVLARPPDLECLEVIAEHYLDVPPAREAELEALRAAYPLLPHGVGLSFGTDAPLDADRLRKTAQLVEGLQPPWFSEHLAFTEVPGWEIGHLAPLPCTRDAVAAVCRNVRRWQSAVGIPLLLENITRIVSVPCELTENQFLTEITERTGCGLLLDLHNVYTNARNHAFDALGFLGELPLERVRQVHVGGGHDEADGYRIDSHSSRVPAEVWKLLRFLCSPGSGARVGAVIVEWDEELPAFEVIREELAAAHQAVGND